MTLTLVQCASGRFVPLQKAIAPHHQAYCEKWGYNYLLHYGQIHRRGPMWDKVVLVPMALSHSDCVVWMDTDSLIVDVSTPLAQAFEDVDYIGHCYHPEPWRHKAWHFNCGVGFYRRNYSVIGFFKDVEKRGVVPHPTWQVQATMLATNDNSPFALMSSVNDKWNSTVGTNESPNPVIQSWHGHNQDFTPILERLEQVKLA